MLVRLLRRMTVCPMVGHQPWPVEWARSEGGTMEWVAIDGADVFCDRCGKVLSKRDLGAL